MVMRRYYWLFATIILLSWVIDTAIILYAY